MLNIHVSVAVIHFGNQYLLGFRDSKQDQGNRFEFIGGKIEPKENAKQALIREVQEEIGLDISTDSHINPLGVLRHYYADKQLPERSKMVCLHVFRVELSEQQFADLVNLEQGCEGQSLRWVNHESLVNNQYRLPDANQTILQWLKLPHSIVITKELQQISTRSTDRLLKDIEQNWVDFYQQKLPPQACVYVRLKQSHLTQREQAIKSLLVVRPDVSLIVDHQVAEHLHQKLSLAPQIIAQHLTENDINLLSVTVAKGNGLSSGLPITVSAHSKRRLQLINQLAQERRQHHLSAVLAVFISPVKQTSTHPEAVSLGWEGFEALAQYSEVPVIGLGGLKPEDINDVRQYSGDKVAGISQFLT